MNNNNNNLLNSYNKHQNTMYNPNINNAFTNNSLLNRLKEQRGYIMDRTNEMREINEVKKLQKVNVNDKRQMEMLRDVLINPVKIEKNNTDVKRAYDLKNSLWKEEIDVMWQDEKNIKNTPYKIIIPQKTKEKPYGFDYTQKIKYPEQLTIHTVTNKDRDKKVFDKNLNKLEGNMKNIDQENKHMYSDEKKSEHKSKFEYEHVYYKKTKSNVKHHDELKIDQESYTKLKTQEHEIGKNTRDEILSSLQNDDDTVTDTKEQPVTKNNSELDSLLNDIIDNSESNKSQQTKSIKQNKNDDIDDILNDLIDGKTNKQINIPIIIQPPSIITQPIISSTILLSDQDAELNRLLAETGLS